MNSKELSILKLLIKMMLIVFMTFFLLDIIKVLFTLNEKKLAYIDIISYDDKITTSVILYIIFRLCSGFLLFLGSIQLFKLINVFNFNVVFEIAFIKQFKKVTYLLLTSSMVGLLGLIFKNFFQRFFNMQGAYLNYFVLIIGLFFLLMYFVLKKASLLKQENDLTI